jgi:hypothetical protein
LRLGCLACVVSLAACAEGITSPGTENLTDGVGNGSVAGFGSSAAGSSPVDQGGGPPQIAGGAPGSAAGAPSSGAGASASSGGASSSAGSNSGGGTAMGSAGSGTAGAGPTSGMCGHFQPGNMGPTLQSKLEGAADSIYFTVEIDNPDDRDVHVGDLKYRYYVDTSDLGTLMADTWGKQIKAVSGTTRDLDKDPTVTFAATYFEVTFPGSTSMISSGESLQVKLHVHNSMYQVHNQTSDYSYNPSATLTPWCHIVLYELAPIAWGTPPTP